MWAYRQFLAADATNIVESRMLPMQLHGSKMLEKDYLDFASSFYQLMGINTPEVNDYSIKVGKAFVEKYAEKSASCALSFTL